MVRRNGPVLADEVNWHTATRCPEVFSLCEFKKQSAAQYSSNAAFVDAYCEVIEGHLPRGGVADSTSAQRWINRALPIEID